RQSNHRCKIAVSHTTSPLTEISKSEDSCISNPKSRNMKLDRQPCVVGSPNLIFRDFGLEMQESFDFKISLSSLLLLCINPRPLHFVWGAGALRPKKQLRPIGKREITSVRPM